ncbi:MAG: ABC transporter ATP-binding protein [Eubacteriales bacterium]|nr:ABC transporter ATP-binding protein [Eubacteriales bacterium]
MENVIEMLGITKRFGSFTAIDQVDFALRKGEIHALLGENGAGKSTLMSVLFGLYTPEEGEIRIQGKTARIRNPNDANAIGIGMVHQHFKLVHNFTVLESIVLGQETTRFKILQMKEAREKIVKLSEQYGLAVDPDAYISDITVGQQQRVEILKMLYRDNEMLIFDEPTAVLTPQEIDELMEIMRRLAAEGKSIIFITHKLKEIKAVSDRCSVLRKGKMIGTVETKDTEPETMSEMMVGRKVDMDIELKPMPQGETILKVSNFSVTREHQHKPAVSNVNFEVHAGEILCIAGIDGNGQSELVYGLTGLMPTMPGSKVELKGKDISKSPIRERCLSGMSHIPEDRHRYGLVLDYNLEQNLVLQTYFQAPFQKHGFIQFPEIRQYAERLIENYDIRSSAGATSSARGMSGGNQQKAIIARELDRGSDLVIAVQPVRGLDVGAIEYIHRRIVEQRDAGKAILLVSFELDEVMNLSDRILVMYEGEFVAELDPKQVDVRELGLYMAGQKRKPLA